MSDLNLLIAGCAVSFIAIAGAYVFLRERFTEGQMPSHDERMLRSGESRDVRDAA